MLQPARCAHNAHIIPHETPQLLPVMLNHHFLVGVADTTVVPGLRRREFSSDPLCDVLCCGLCVNEALEQRVAGHAIRSVQPRTR